MNNLQEYREKNNLSVKRLANIFKVTQGTILAWEKGTKTPSMTQLESLSYLYDCSFDDLFPYTKPDPYDFQQRKSAVFKRYKRRLNKILISLIIGITLVSLAIVFLVGLTPQIHAKWHAQHYFDEMKEYVYKETKEQYGTIITFAKEHSDFEATKNIGGVAVVTYDSKYLIYFHYDKMRSILDISEGLTLTATATVDVNGNTFTLDIADYQDVYYIVLYESPEPGLKQIVEQYKISNGITA